jgi:hypothetical protein
MAQAVESLPCKYKAPSSNLATAKKKKKKMLFVNVSALQWGSWLAVGYCVKM